MIAPERALRGREQEMQVAERHAVLGTPMKPPFPEGFEQLVVGMGCFWGAERMFWQAEGVYTTAVGYAGGYTPNPTYEEVCSGSTGHAEVVLVVFDPAKTSYERMLAPVLGEPRPDAGDAPGQRRGDPVPLGDLLGHRGPAPARAGDRATPTTSGSGRRATRRSRPRSPRPVRSTTPRTTTSSTWRRTPGLLRARRHRRELPGRARDARAGGRRRAGRGRRIASGSACGQPPATAGRIVITSPSETRVSRQSRKRMSSSPT